MNREVVQVAAVIPAAGSGRRMGGGRNKVLLSLAGRPVLAWAAAPLCASGSLDVLVIVARAEELDEISALCEGFPVQAALVPGGAERSDSVRAGLEWLEAWPGWLPSARHLAAIHDAARPMLTVELWERILAEACRVGAAVPGVAVADSLKRVDKEGLVIETVERAGLWQVQTPQVFEFEPLLAAHREAKRRNLAATDDARVWELTGRPLAMVEGERRNFKITTQDDLVLAEALLTSGGDGG